MGREAESEEPSGGSASDGSAPGVTRRIPAGCGADACTGSQAPEGAVSVLWIARVSRVEDGRRESHAVVWQLWPAFSHA
jgi:hypothetical protein